MISLIGLSKTFNRGQITAVKDVTLDICDGEVFGLLGPNGAGGFVKLSV